MGRGWDADETWTVCGRDDGRSHDGECHQTVEDRQAGVFRRRRRGCARGDGLRRREEGRDGVRRTVRQGRASRAGRQRRSGARLLSVVDEVAPGPVRTEADRMEGAAEFSLVFRVPLQIAQLAHAVRELALVAILAGARLLVRPTQLGLVAGSVLRGLRRRRGRRLGGRALQSSVR